MADKEKIAARLTLIVDYNEVQDPEDVERIVDEAKAYGHVTKADYEVLVPYKMDLR